jgi:hypothetical protein
MSELNIGSQLDKRLLFYSLNLTRERTASIKFLNGDFRLGKKIVKFVITAS